MSEEAQSLAVLGGRSGPTSASVPSVQAFGQYANAAGALAAERVVEEQTWYPVEDTGCPHEGLFRVSTWGVEVQRSNVNGGLSNLDAATILATGVQGRSRVGFQILVSDHVSPATRRYEIDAGQSLNLTASAVTVKAILPGVSVVIPPGTAAGTAAAVLNEVYDAVAGAKILRVEEDQSTNEALRTRYLTVLANTAGIMQVPPGAREVSIYQTAAGVASPLWQMRAGPGAAGLIVGVLPWIGATRRTEQQTLLPNVTELVTDIDVGNGRNFVAVFTIRP